MSLRLVITEKPIYTIVEEDIQTVARYRLHRDLTSDELASACHAFGNAMDWWEVAECAIDLAVKAEQ